MESHEIQRLLDNPEYHMSELSDAILNIPNEYRLLEVLGLFPERGIRTTEVKIERKTEYQGLIPAGVRGTPGSKGGSKKRDMIVLPTFHFPHEDKLSADELQGLPAFGAPGYYEGFDELLYEKHEDALNKFRRTAEFLKWGALNGVVYDADGVTELYDVYELMGETRKVFEFDFDDADEDVIADQAVAVRRYIEDEANGEPIHSVVVLCGANFMDNVTRHPALKKAYEQQNRRVAPNPVFEDLFQGFEHYGLTFVEHRGNVSYKDPETGVFTKHKFIDPDEAIIVPLGTRQVFQSYFAPGSTIETVNMPGQFVYADMQMDKWKTGIEMRYESNPLYMVKKPRLVCGAKRKTS